MKRIIESIKKIFFNHLNLFLIVIYISVIFIGGFFIYNNQAEILVSEEINSKKYISQYKDYFKENSDEWYNGKEMNLDGIDEEIIKNIVNSHVSINNYNRGASADSQKVNMSLSVAIPFSADIPNFSTIEYTGKFNDSLKNWIQLGDFVGYKTELTTLEEEYALFYTELFCSEFNTFKITFCEEDVFEIRQYDVITGETIYDTGKKECIKITMTFKSKEDETNLYLLIDKQVIGKVYMDVINNLYKNGSVCKVNEQIPVYELSYVVSNGQKGTTTCTISGKEFLHTLLKNSSLYNDAICTYIPKKNTFSVIECLYISTMYATTTGYDGISLNSNFLRFVVMLEAIIANSVIISICVSFFTDFISKQKEKYLETN
ncbi:MAG: hypothetical protein IJD58_04270 [Lachnospiraceae bacterium]|nr:hypothetical protein [Lachnospiraceae bacterium]